MSLIDAFNEWLQKEGLAPRPGLVFDRQKHRWVRPDTESPKISMPHSEKIDSITGDLTTKLKNQYKKMGTNVKDLTGEQVKDAVVNEFHKVAQNYFKKIEFKHKKVKNMGYAMTRDYDDFVRSNMKNIVRDVHSNLKGR